jgi:hypothetical protein
MNKIQSLLAATVLVGGLVSPALAADSSSHHETMGHKHHQGEEQEHFSPAHQMSGAISKIDHASGILEVKTQEGAMLTLHFPTKQIQDLKEGDQVTVKMRIAKAATPPVSQPTKK